jgi:hypothetical protein
MIEHHDEYDPTHLMYVFKQLYAFFSGDALHHHSISTQSIQYTINQMIHSGFARDALDFGVII